MGKILVILGPTSTGKTDLALQLASKFQGELVSVDSRQVYKGLDIGTGKLPSSKFKVPASPAKRGEQSAKLQKHDGFWEINGIKIWMYDMVNPKAQYTVADYVKDSSRIIEEIREGGKLPIIVGGTGFYLKVLLEGLSNLTSPIDLKLRKELEKLSLDQLQKKLQEVSPQRWGKMNNSDRQNPRRLIRAIEIAIKTKAKNKVDKNLTIVNFLSTADRGKPQKNILKIGLTTSREVLYKRIDDRVVSRINQGMIDEAEKLHKEGLSFKRMRQLGLEYGVLAEYLEGKIQGQDTLIKILQGKIHGYARRQITWFKREKGISWFDVTNDNYLSKVENLVAKWYYLADDTKS